MRSFLARVAAIVSAACYAIPMLAFGLVLGWLYVSATPPVWSLQRTLLAAVVVSLWLLGIVDYVSYELWKRPILPRGLRPSLQDNTTVYERALGGIVFVAGLVFLLTRD